MEPLFYQCLAPETPRMSRHYPSGEIQPRPFLVTTFSRSVDRDGKNLSRQTPWSWRSRRTTCSGREARGTAPP